METKITIHDVYLWSNQQLMVFDMAGQQIAEYQGAVKECLPRVLRDAPPNCRFVVGDWRGWSQEVDRYHMELRAIALGAAPNE